MYVPIKYHIVFKCLSTHCGSNNNTDLRLWFTSSYRRAEWELRNVLGQAHQTRLSQKHLRSRETRISLMPSTYVPNEATVDIFVFLSDRGECRVFVWMTLRSFALTKWSLTCTSKWAQGAPGEGLLILRANNRRKWTIRSQSLTTTEAHRGQMSVLLFFLL